MKVRSIEVECDRPRLIAERKTTQAKSTAELQPGNLPNLRGIWWQRNRIASAPIMRQPCLPENEMQHYQKLMTSSGRSEKRIKCCTNEPRKHFKTKKLWKLKLGGFTKKWRPKFTGLSRSRIAKGQAQQKRTQPCNFHYLGLHFPTVNKEGQIEKRDEGGPKSAARASFVTSPVWGVSLISAFYQASSHPWLLFASPSIFRPCTYLLCCVACIRLFVFSSRYRHKSRYRSCLG